MSVLDIIGYSRHVSPSGQSVNYTSLLSFRTILGSVMDVLGAGRCVIPAEISTRLFAIRVPPKQVYKSRMVVYINATSTLRCHKQTFVMVHSASNASMPVLSCIFFSKSLNSSNPQNTPVLHPQQYIILHELALNNTSKRSRPHPRLLSTYTYSHIHTYIRLKSFKDPSEQTPARRPCTTNLSPGALPPRLISSSHAYP